MQSQTIALRMQRLADVRRWEDAHLPIYGSLLGRDLLLLLARFHLEERRFTLKEIYFSLPYSENAIRLHLKRLMKDGWLRLSDAGPDRRFRYLTPSEKLSAMLDTYIKEARLADDAEERQSREMPAKAAVDTAQRRNES